MAKHPAAVALGRLGGRVTSPAKAAASRKNAEVARKKLIDMRRTKRLESKS